MMKRFLNFTGRAWRNYMNTLAATNALMPSGMIPYNIIKEYKEKARKEC